jgi:hypothetical protein
MPQINYSEQTGLDFARIATFLDTIDLSLKSKAITEIIKGIGVLKNVMYQHFSGHIIKQL